MNERLGTDLDRVFDEAARDFAQRIGALASGPVLRAALIGPALASLVLALEDEFPNCDDVIQEELQRQAGILEDEARAKVISAG